MPDFDVEAFVTKLDRLGVKLTAVPLADGKLRVSRWRMLNATEHAQQIEDLWTLQIGNDQERIDILAAHLANAAPGKAADCVSSGPLRIASPSIAVPERQEPQGVQLATSASTVASSHPHAGSAGRR
jgi:hypothetical protein